MEYFELKSYSVPIVIGVFLNFLNFLASTMLNLNNLKSQNYVKVKEHYSYLEFKKMSLYSLSRTKAEAVFVFFSIVSLLLFWLFDGFRILDDYVRTLREDTILRGSVYLILIFTFFVILRFLYDLYINFIIDKRYRITRMNLKEFLVASFKKFSIAYIIAGIIFISLFYSYVYFGDNFWWGIWITASVVIVLYYYMYPSIYLYFLNKVNNAVSPELRNKILDFCNKIDFPISNINIFESSQKTNKLNAFFAGFGNNKNIILSDNLINNFSDDEILAVIGHEAGHYKLNHNIYNILISIGLSGVTLYLFNYFISDLTIFKSFYVYNLSFYVGIALYAVLFSTFTIILMPLINSYLRENERKADEFSYNFTNNKEALISAVLKIYKMNLLNPLPHSYYVFFYYKRNPAEKRIKYIEGLK